MNEYADYMSTVIRNREIFCLNYASDLSCFYSLLSTLRSVWQTLGATRDNSGRSQAGLLLFSNLLIRHCIFGFQHVASYQSFLAWLTFRPGLEALLIIGKFLDDPANSQIWKNRQTDAETYRKTFSGRGLASRSLPQSEDFRKVLTRLNDNFMHPNPDFTYRDAVRRNEKDAVTLEIQFFDQNPDLHEGHLLAYLNLTDLIVKASDDLVSGLCGLNACHVPAYSQTNSNRAVQAAGRGATAKRIMEELGLWTF